MLTRASKYSHKKYQRLEIWAVKLRFLLISENILRNNATARSESKIKYENMASNNTQITLHLIYLTSWLLIEKQPETDRKKMFTFVKNFMHLKISL